MLVKYTNKQGFVEVRAVPNDASPDTYHKGVLIGPPESLQTIDLPKEKIKELYKKLVEAGFLNHKDLQGNRSVLLQIVRDIGGKDFKSLRNKVLSLYQREYYPEKFE